MSIGDFTGSTPGRVIGSSNAVINCPITTKTMRKVEAGMVFAIQSNINSDKSGRVFKSGNTEVHVIHNGVYGTPSYNRTIEVLLHDNVIAVFEPSINRVRLSDCGYETATTKSRLNVLIDCFTEASRVFQNRHVWYQGDDLWMGEHSIKFVHKHPDDCWQLKQAILKA